MLEFRFLHTTAFKYASAIKSQRNTFSHSRMTLSATSFTDFWRSVPSTRFSFDLHVLGAPPAFVLSQDQTLKLII